MIQRAVTDRERQSFRGPVRKVTTQWAVDDGPRLEEQVLDRRGNLIRLRVRGPEGEEHSIEFRAESVERLGPKGRMIRNGDGSLTVIHDISGMKAWSMDGLHECGFGTWGSAFARTEFDPQGIPIVTVFENNRNQKQHTIQYICDAKGNILEAVQYSASPSVLVPVDALQRGAEQFRVSFRYDNANRVIEQETYFTGQRIHYTVTTYNEQGDAIVSVYDGKSTRFEYNYDHHNNWIHKVAYHPPPNPPTEYRRTIEYCDE